MVSDVFTILLLYEHIFTFPHRSYVIHYKFDSKFWLNHIHINILVFVFKHISYAAIDATELGAYIERLTGERKTHNNEFLLILIVRLFHFYSSQNKKTKIIVRLKLTEIFYTYKLYLFKLFSTFCKTVTGN